MILHHGFIRSAALLLLMLGIVAAASGCSNNTTSPDGDAITITDALGRVVTVEREPQRTAALLGSFAEVWMLAGGDICATAEDAWEDFGLDLPDAVSIGGAHSPNPELLLASEPDLVIASASTSANVELLPLLESAGITTIYFDVDCFEDYLAMLDICTRLTGRRDLYEQNGEAIAARIESVRAECRSAGLTEQERSVLLLRASSGFIRAKGSEGTILGEMLADLGCINIADSDGSLLETLSVESVIRSQPHRIFIVTMGDDTQRAMQNVDELIRGDPAWGTLDAVESGRLHIMERELFNIKPNARWAISYEKLGEILLGE